jgi:uncharacterized repeat protein (TIGR03803 family)
MRRIVNALGKLNRAKWACAFFVLCAMTAIALPAQTFATLYRFGGTDGAYPYAGLIQATNGGLYGTTYFGGANGSGTVFKITPSGTLTTIYNFCSQSGCTDGAEPVAGLVQATNGNFYGTTYSGGANSSGTVFKITPNGTLTTLYNFCSQSGCTDGQDPYAGLVQAANGDFYGTTQNGGASVDEIANGGGTVFKITPSGNLTTLYSFCSQSGCTDGQNPYAGLVRATNGDFYGTTAYGGANNGGTVFKITASGALTTLFNFCPQDSYPSCIDGAWPYAGLVQAINGDLYGTTYAGGATGNGTAFKITPSGTLTTLYNFCTEGVNPSCPDGAWPDAALVQATDGNFYGTTALGGGDAQGTVFKITPSGTLTTLQSFDGRNGIAARGGGLFQATNGDFYGTAYEGGEFGCGTVFSFSVGLGPFVKTLPHSGMVGAAIIILGTDLTGTTSVSFNGTPAAFEVVSATQITTTVPAGATTGRIQVITPGGALFSGGPFLVLP